jgi:hypothetical protein
VDWSRLPAGRCAGPGKGCIASHDRRRNAPQQAEADAARIGDAGLWHGDTAPFCHAGGRGFESRRSRKS